MKIIGKSEGGLLMSASENEVANLIGYYYGRAEKCPELKPGLEIRVGSMYDQLYELSRQGGKLEQLAVKLEAIAALLRAQNPVVTEVAEKLSVAMKQA